MLSNVSLFPRTRQATELNFQTRILLRVKIPPPYPKRNHRAQRTFALGITPRGAAWACLGVLRNESPEQFLSRRRGVGSKPEGMWGAASISRVKLQVLVWGALPKNLAWKDQEGRGQCPESHLLYRGSLGPPIPTCTPGLFPHLSLAVKPSQPPSGWKQPEGLPDMQP